MRRALVSLPDYVWQVIDQELKGKLGNGDSEVIRVVVISYLIEKGYLLKPSKKKMIDDQIASELDIHDTMLTSLVDLLAEKGYIKSSDWELRIKKQISRANLSEKDRDKLK